MWRFSSGDAGVQQLNLYLKTPSSYVAGTQITLKIGLYSPSSSNTILLQTTTRLYEDNEDLSASPTGHASGNSALTNTVSNGFRSTTLNLTDSSGQIDGQAVNADELLKVELVRGTDSDTADIRFIPGSTEAIFA